MRDLSSFFDADSAISSTMKKKKKKKEEERRRKKEERRKKKKKKKKQITKVRIMRIISNIHDLQITKKL